MIVKHNTTVAEKAGAVQHVFIIRYRERLDNVDYGWVRRAERLYDPPLMEDGMREASEAGKRFKDKVRVVTLMPWSCGPVYKKAGVRDYGKPTLKVMHLSMSSPTTPRAGHIA